MNKDNQIVTGFANTRTIDDVPIHVYTSSRRLLREQKIRDKAEVIQRECEEAAATRDLSKLPKWARNEIEVLRRERDEAVALMKKAEDSQKPTQFYSEEIICGEGEPRIMRIYYDAYEIRVDSKGITASISPSDNGVQIRFHHKSGVGKAAIIPNAANSIEIVEVK